MMENTIENSSSNDDEIELIIGEKKEIQSDYHETNASIFPTLSGSRNKKIKQILRDPREIVKFVMPLRQKNWDVIYKFRSVILLLLASLAYILYIAKIFTKKVSENQTTTAYFYHKTDERINAINLFMLAIFLIFMGDKILNTINAFIHGQNERKFLKFYKTKRLSKINVEGEYFILYPELKHFSIWIEDHQKLIRHLATEKYWIGIACLLIAMVEQFRFTIPIPDGIQEGNGENNKFEDNAIVKVKSDIYKYFFRTNPAIEKELSEEEKEPTQYFSCLPFFVLNQITHELICCKEKKPSSKSNLVLLLKELLNYKDFSENIDKKFLNPIQKLYRLRWSLIFAFLLTSEGSEKGTYIMYVGKVFDPTISDVAKEALPYLKNLERERLYKSLQATKFGGAVKMKFNGDTIESNRLHHSTITFKTPARKEREAFQKEIEEKNKAKSSSKSPLLGKKGIN